MVKYFNRSFLLFLMMLFRFFVAFGQPYDFDSLLKVDNRFKTMFETKYQSMDIFAWEKPIQMTISSDFKKLVKEKYKDEYQPAILNVTLNDTIVATREIEIKPRGNMRKQICYYPPLKLNFPKKEIALDLMHEFDKMKMVVNCKKGSLYEQYLLSEYYVYKVLNPITEYSFRVRLLEVTYQDTGERYKPDTGYAYIIESIDQLAERLNAIPFEREHIRDILTENENLAKIYLFQYLIGNTDWSIPGAHNMKMVISKDPTKTAPFAIPYDFDYAGIVNTNYAIPDEQLRIESVRERVYRGVCIKEADLQKAAEYFIKKKDVIYAVYESTPKLAKSTLKETLYYLDEFYDIIENEALFKRYILESCRQ